MTDRLSSDHGRSSSQRRSSFKLKSISDGSGSRQKRAPREQYPTDTIDLVGRESVERILPPNRIRKTLEVNVNHPDVENQSASLGGSRSNIGYV